MIKILLVCYSGISTSILLERMILAKPKQGKDILIEASGIDAVEYIAEDFDIILLSPPVVQDMARINSFLSEKKTRCIAMRNRDYQHLDGDRVLDYAINFLDSV